jgi:type IV secretory pathway VirB3-like protein
MVSAKEYSLPVHRSLLQRELILGIPQMGLLILLALCFFFLYTLRMYFMAIPVAILYIVMRVLTKKDPFMIDIVIEHVNQKDVLLP